MDPSCPVLARSQLTLSRRSDSLADRRRDHVTGTACRQKIRPGHDSPGAAATAQESAKLHLWVPPEIPWGDLRGRFHAAARKEALPRALSRADPTRLIDCVM